MSIESRTRLQRHWPLLVIALCALMLAFLAGLQFVWTGQLSQGQAAMMKNTLDGSIRQLHQEVEREFLSLVGDFQRDVRGPTEAEWAGFAESYSLWSETSFHPQLVRRLLIAGHDSGGQGTLREVTLGTGEMVDANWDPELEPLKVSIEAVQRNPRRGRNQRPFGWTLFPEASAVTRPLQDFGRNRGQPPRGPRGDGQQGFLIIVLDWGYVVGTMLPALVEQFFAGAGGDRLYDVALVAGGDREFIYRSSPTLDSEWLVGADSRTIIRFAREPSARSQLQGPGPQGGRRAQPFGRGRLVLAGSGAPLEVEIAAKHVAGSLQAVVEQQRVRNLAMGFGVLLLLGSAMALVIVSARRAARLAGMQMEFVAGVTHELRTPLSVICSVGENLSDGVVASGRHVQRYGQLIRDQGHRLAEMVEQTLQFAAMESGQRRFQLGPVAPSAIVQSAVDQALPMIEQAGFSLERDEAPGLPAVTTDEKAVQQVLANLLSNAVKYGEPARSVRIESSVEHAGRNPEVQIRVRDRGMGIPAKETRRIFDAFFRGAAASEENIQGSGLGLKLARDLARGMGGNLSVRSDPGKGSEFTLHLPVHSGEPA